MSASLLEVTRTLHQDVEQAQRVIASELSKEMRTDKEQIQQEHAVRKRIEKVQTDMRKIADIYEDADGLRKQELNDLKGDQDTMLHMFYDRVRTIREYHRKFPTASIKLDGSNSYESLIL